MDVKRELLECLKYEDASSKIQELDNKGLLEQVIPEIKDMKDVGECKYHVVDSYKHSLYTLMHFEDTLKTEKFLPSHLRKEVFDYLSSKDASGFPIIETLKLGVFLHDIGKPAAKTVDSNGRAHFKGHDLKGGEIVSRLAEELGLSETTNRKLTLFVKCHMILLFLYKTNGFSEENLWKLFGACGDDIIGLMLLGYCDLAATRKLKYPDEDQGVIKTYMEFVLTCYFYRYKSNKEI